MTESNKQAFYDEIDKIEEHFDICAGLGCKEHIPTSEQFPFFPKDNTDIKIQLSICLENYAYLQSLYDGIRELVNRSNIMDTRFDCELLTLGEILQQIKLKAEYLQINGGK